MGALLVFCQVTTADTMMLANGDRLTGSLVEISDGVVVFRTTLAGQVIVPASRVDALTSDGAYVITFEDDLVETATFVQDEDGPHIQKVGSNESTPVDLGAIVSTEPAPEATESGEGVRIDLGAGVLYRDGNESTTAPYTDLRIRYPGERTQFGAGVMMDLKDEDFPRYLNSYADWTWLPGNAFRPLFRLSYERDTLSALDYRTGATVGVRGAFLDTNRQTLEGDLGLNLALESYDADYLWNRRDFASPTRWSMARSMLTYRDDYDDETNTEINLAGRLWYGAEVAPRLRFEDELEVYAGLTDPGMRMRNASRLLVPLTSRFALKLEVQVDYEDSPQYRKLDQWRSSVGAGFEVGF
jgi:hypothetical protein